MLTRIAPSQSSVLILGPTGAGKDVAAQAIHAASGRKGEFVAINCAAIPAELLESELFGHEKGAFTGADKRRVGHFEMAEGGTVFLDEIGDMPLALQAKLLRVLETQTIRRLGGSQDISVDFRLITATHRDLDTLVSQGTFREDLKFRIAVFPVKIAPLNERTGDIPCLIDHLMERFGVLFNEPNLPHFSLDAMRVLAAYKWPGNVRELRNVVERAMVFFPGEVISKDQVIENLLQSEIPVLQDVHPVEDAIAVEDINLPNPLQFRNALRPDQSIDLRCYLRDIEAALIETAVNNVDGNVTLAANALGLQRTTLIEKMKKMDIKR